jgi:hypothetical protein
MSRCLRVDVYSFIVSHVRVGSYVFWGCVGGSTLGSVRWVSCINWACEVGLMHKLGVWGGSRTNFGMRRKWVYATDCRSVYESDYSCIFYGRKSGFLHFMGRKSGFLRCIRFFLFV